MSNSTDLSGIHPDAYIREHFPEVVSCPSLDMLAVDDRGVVHRSRDEQLTANRGYDE